MKKKHTLLIVLIFLAAHSFYNPFGIISPQLGKFVFYVFGSVGLWMAYRAKKPENYRKFPCKYLFLIMTGFVCSIFMGTYFHDQSISVSIITTIPYILGYAYLYILVKLNPEISRVDTIFKGIVVASGIMYIANLVAFPDKIFGESMNEEDYDMSRGFARIGVSMILLVVTAFFYFINQWLKDSSKRWIKWIVACILLIVMSLTRQVIVFSFLLGGLFVMQKSSMAKKLAVVLVVTGFAVFVLPEIPIFKAMMELSETQAERNKYEKEDIRITAWRFYTTEYHTNNLSPILGNGIPAIGRSKWGNRHEREISADLGGNACYGVDVGWAGFFWQFGIISTIGLLLLFLKGIRRKKDRDMQYTTYSLLFCCITAAFSGPILFFHQITELALIFFLAYQSRSSRRLSRGSEQLRVV